MTAGAGRKKRLITASISTSDITNSVHAQASSHGFSFSENDSIKNIAKNVLNHGKAMDGAERETKSAISDSTIVITDEAGQMLLTGQNSDHAIVFLNRDTVNAHKGVSPIDVTKLEQIVHENREMAMQLLEKGFKYSDESYKTMFLKEHPLAMVDRDEQGNIIYKTDENGVPIKDARGQNISKFHCLTDEENQHLQEDSDGRVHVFFNGIFTPPEEATVYAEQHAKDKMYCFILLCSQKPILLFQNFWLQAIRSF
ncbi:hypothetical protein [Bartonella sp. B1099]|uniref:hypothetical protein n=1 Tax=Bartonella sp. B1099 TaxID=2911422 RepID=UPI003531F5D3